MSLLLSVNAGEKLDECLALPDALAIQLAAAHQLTTLNQARSAII